MTTTITTIKPELNAWTDRNGKIRRYINNWTALVGFETEYYKTGNLSYVELDGQRLSNSGGGKALAGKVWLDADDALHFDYHQDNRFIDVATKRARITAALIAHDIPVI